MSHTHQLKTAARLLAAHTGHPYQACLTAAGSRDLSPLTGDPHTLTDLLAVQLLVAGEPGDLADVRRGILEVTLAAVVIRHHPDAAVIVIASDEDEPVIARLARVDLIDGGEVDGFTSPAGGDALPWANALAAALSLPAGDWYEVRLPRPS